MPCLAVPSLRERLERDATDVSKKLCMQRADVLLVSFDAVSELP